MYFNKFFFFLSILIIDKDKLKEMKELNFFTFLKLFNKLKYENKNSNTFQ